MKRKIPKAKLYFTARDQQWVGAYVALLEPEYAGIIRNGPRLAYTDAFVPVSIEGVPVKTVPIDFSDNVYVKPLVLYVEDISFTQVKAVIVCGSDTCGGQHDTSSCPALASTDVNRRRLVAKVGSKDGGLEPQTITSARLAQVFMAVIKASVSKHLTVNFIMLSST